MIDRYYAFSKGRKRGPFSLDDLLDETERGQIKYEDLCLRIGSSTCERIREVLDWEDKHLILPPELQDEDIPQKPSPTHDELDELELIDVDDRDLGDEESSEIEEDEFEEISEDEDEDDEFEDSEQSEQSEDHEELEDLEELEELDETSRPPRDSTAILYSGRPSILSFPKSLLLVALSLGAGFWFHNQFEWILTSGIALALITFLLAQFRRARHRYLITPKQVEIIHGLLLENSREICIEDIGAIHIRQRGFHGLLGLASIEFATAESPMPILVFYNVRSARRIKDLVRRLQDALELDE